MGELLNDNEEILRADRRKIVKTYISFLLFSVSKPNKIKENNENYRNEDVDLDFDLLVVTSRN